MNIRERIIEKVNKQKMEMLPDPEKVILGREEYHEWMNSAVSLCSYTDFNKNGGVGAIMGLKITLSRRPRYLCVVSRKERQRRYKTSYPCDFYNPA